MSADRRRQTFDHGRDLTPVSPLVEALSIIVLLGVVIGAGKLVAALAAMVSP